MAARGKFSAARSVFELIAITRLTIKRGVPFISLLQKSAANAAAARPSKNTHWDVFCLAINTHTHAVYIRSSLVLLVFSLYDSGCNKCPRGGGGGRCNKSPTHFFAAPYKLHCIAEHYAPRLKNIGSHFCKRHSPSSLHSLEHVYFAKHIILGQLL
jgi:hypothetical protein